MPPVSSTPTIASVSGRARPDSPAAGSPVATRLKRFHGAGAATPVSIAAGVSRSRSAPPSARCADRQRHSARSVICGKQPRARINHRFTADVLHGSSAAHPWHEYAIARKLHLLLSAGLYDEAAKVVSQASATRTSEAASAAAIAGMGRLGQEELLRIVHPTTRERPVFYVGDTRPEVGSARDDDSRRRGPLSALACMALLLRVMHPLSQLPVTEIPRDDVGTYSRHLGAAAAQLAGLTREDIAKCAEFDPDKALPQAVQWATYFLYTTTAFLKDEHPFHPPLRQADLMPLADETLATLRIALSQAAVLVGKSALVEPLAFEKEVERRTASALTHARQCARVAATALHSPAITDSARTHALRHLAQAMARYTAQRHALGDPAAATPNALARQLARGARAKTAGGTVPDSAAIGTYVPCVVEALGHIVPALERLAKHAPPASALQACAVKQQYAELSNVQAFLRALYPAMFNVSQPDGEPRGLRPARRAHGAAARFHDAWEAMRRDWNGEFGIDLARRDDGAMVLDLPQTAMQRPISAADLAAVYSQARDHSDADAAWRFRLDTRYGHALSVHGSDTLGRLVSYQWPDPFAGEVSQEALAGGGESFPEEPPESRAALRALSQLAPTAERAIAPLANQAILAAVQSSLKPGEPGARLAVPEAVWLPANKALPLRDGQSMIYCRNEAGPRAHHQVCRHADGHFQLDVELRYDDPILRGPDGRTFRSAERLDVSVTFSLAVAADGSGAALVEPPMIRHWYAADAASLVALAALPAQAGEDTSGQP